MRSKEEDMGEGILIRTLRLISGMAISAVMALAASAAAFAESGSIYQATLAEHNPKTPEVSTDELRRILADRSAIVLDTRKRSEYVAGHIPGALNLDAPPSGIIASVDPMVRGDKTKALVLYCNGPFCQASRRLGEQLVASGFSNVRRYQLGIPIWRALGGPTEIELEGVLRIFKIDQTAVFLDARSVDDFSKGSLPGAHNVPPTKLALNELLKAPLPRDDFNTRIVLFGRDAAQARALADAMSKTPWHNVTYFPGTFETLKAALRI